MLKAFFELHSTTEGKKIKTELKTANNTLLFSNQGEISFSQSGISIGIRKIDREPIIV